LSRAGSRDAPPVETEWQFDAIDVRPVERWLAALPLAGSVTVEPGPAWSIIDTYFDTRDWRLHRAGYSLRIRRKAGTAEATLKSLDEGADGFRQRTEFTEPLAGRDATAFVSASGPVAMRAKLAAGKEALEPLFEVRTRRRVYRMTVDGSPAGEIAVDRTNIPLGERSESARLRRVEIEVPEERVGAALPFVQSLRSALGLQPATLSKFQAGLLARGLQPAVAPDLGPTTVDPEATVGEVAFAVLRRHLTALLASEPGTRIGDDPEELHDMRVATRRLRAALSMFADVLPVRFARLRDELGWVADALGEVRDLDVQLERTDEWTRQSAPEDGAALAPIRQLLEEQRAASRLRLVAVLDAVRYERLVSAFVAALQHGPLRTSPLSHRPVLAAAPDLISKRYRSVRKAGRRITGDSSPKDYHKVRIRSKRLRYALEFLSEVYPQQIAPLVKRLVSVQDLLGLHQDADVAVQQLRSMVSERGESLAPATVFAMGIVARRYGEQQEALRARFPKVYGRLTGKRWKALRREMERRRPAVPAVTPSSPVLQSVEKREGEPASPGAESLARPTGAG
jgi:triphosphatase